ncbi:MAG TPA: acyltransferase domain-containing protein [Casimicrobiaceae bacterium]
MLGILCPGQGAQHAGMLDLLLADSHAAGVLDAVEPMFGAHPRILEADAPRLFDNDVAQPLICAAQVAAWEGLRRHVPAPLAFAGYSVGELASHACAGAVDAATVVRLAQRRAALMEQAAVGRPGGMIALGGPSRADIDELCRDRPAWPAIVIDRTTFVIGGTDSALAALSHEARARGWKVTCLKVGVASHTPLLSAAVEPFRLALEEAGLRDTRIPVMSGIDGRLQILHAQAIDSLAQQLSHAIEWSHCLEALRERGCRVFLELGPGRALSHMLCERFRDCEARALADFRTLRGAAQWVNERCAAT